MNFSFDNIFSSLTDIFSGPAVNVDGTPMVGDVDINGNVFGVTEPEFSSCDSFSSGCDSFGGSDPFSF